MPGRECHHCKQWIEQGEAHDYWTTTEAALTEDLCEDLREAWERLRETAAAFGEQRTYASSFIERQNLTMRMGMRRFTRLTNAFSSFHIDST